MSHTSQGLGTSTSAEAREYFSDLAKSVKEYVWDDTTNKFIELAFDSKKTDERKAWLLAGIANDTLDYALPRVPYSDFVNRGLIHFSHGDNVRSLPALEDGLKPSQRKALFGLIDLNVTTDQKVAQLVGKVASRTAYHHGEASLCGTIVNMAQDYTGANNIPLFVPSGQFGCLDPETDVLMWNGTTKKARDVRVGDQLVGDDGRVRNVLRTTDGVDDMYRVTMSDGESYVVNSQHILTLVMPLHKTMQWQPSSSSWRATYYDADLARVKMMTTHGNHFNASKRTIGEMKAVLDAVDSENTFDVKLADYMNMSAFSKTMLYCVKNSSPIEWDSRPVPIDPYIFGCWLGDGTSKDESILRDFAIYADTIGCELVHDVCGNRPNGEVNENYHFTIRKRLSGFRMSIGDENHSPSTCKGGLTSGKTHSICSWKFAKSAADTDMFKGETIEGRKRSEMNPWKELLRKNGLFNNKHVPEAYILNDKRIRLELLAGLIDTDGSLRTNPSGVPHFEIAQCARLHSDIIGAAAFIAQSLGLRTSVNTNHDALETRTMLILAIFGAGIENIPTRLAHKKFPDGVVRKKNAHAVSFTVESVGKGEFCGWSVDGNERFLLGDFTVTHNSRLLLGKDSASPRYIFTRLAPLTKLLFPDADMPVLEYAVDDGEQVEPKRFVPILPMLLVNGATGIGTGWSTDVLEYNPKELAQVLMGMLDGGDACDVRPWYRGFRGSIEGEHPSYKTRGVYEVVDATTVRVTEIPLGVSFEDYKKKLEDKIQSGDIKDYVNDSTEERPNFKVVFPGAVPDDVYKALDLVSTLVKAANMHCFFEGTIRKFNTTKEIIEAFYGVRLELYGKRREYLIARLNRELERLSERVRFIRAVLDGTIVVNNQPRSAIEARLASLNFKQLARTEDGAVSYDYLLGMAIYSLTREKVQELERECDAKRAELEEVTSCTPEQMWRLELHAFIAAYDAWLEARERSASAQSMAKKRPHDTGGGSGGTNKKKAKIDAKA